MVSGDDITSYSGGRAFIAENKKYSKGRFTLSSTKFCKLLRIIVSFKTFVLVNFLDLRKQPQL